MFNRYTFALIFIQLVWSGVIFQQK